MRILKGEFGILVCILIFSSEKGKKEEEDGSVLVLVLFLVAE
jgi:hypothetical protein